MSLFIFNFQYRGQEKENGNTEKLVPLSHRQGGAHTLRDDRVEELREEC